LGSVGAVLASAADQTAEVSISLDSAARQVMAGVGEADTAWAYHELAQRLAAQLADLHADLAAFANIVTLTANLWDNVETVAIPSGPDSP
jgi:hypothetical protein